MNQRVPLPPEIERLIEEVLAASGLGPAASAEVEAELRAHFEDGHEAGVDWEALRRRFGDPRAAGGRIAAARGGEHRGFANGNGRWWMSGVEWWTEVKRSLRRLARVPGFAVVVVLTLALGVGANTAIFTVVEATLLRPLPYSAPEQLVRVYEARPDNRTNGGYLRGPTVAAFRTWTEVFDGFGALYTYQETGADLGGGAGPLRVTTMPVSAGFFETLGVPPALGRTFREEESVAPGEQGEGGTFGVPLAAVAILSHRLWSEHFDRATDIVGRTIRLDDRPFEVVGVMPEGFTAPFGPRADLWTPQDLRPGGGNSWGNFYLSAVARLRPGLTPAAAQARLDARYARFLEANPEAGSEWVPRVVPLRDDLVGPTRRSMLLILAAAAVLVLLTACVNLTNLLFARGLGRDRDVAVSAALGAGKERIVAGLLVETGILALAGGVAGAVLGGLGVRGLLSLAPDALPSLAEPRLGWAAFGFAFLLTLVALVLSGLTPALRLARTPPAGTLRGDGRATAGRGARRFRDGLAILQVAAALILVTGAALLARSFGELTDVPLGIDERGVLTFQVHLPASRYPDGAARHAFHRTFHDRLAELPQVERAGAVSWLPVNGRFNAWGVYWDESFDPEAPRIANDNAWVSTDIRVFAGDYLDVVDLQVQRGIHPRDADLEGEPVVWVSASLVRVVFDEVEPLGKAVFVANEVRRIVGVVEDTPHDAEGGLAPVTYIPHDQFADDRNWALFQTLAVRGDVAGAREHVREVLTSIDAQLVLHRPEPLAAVVATARAQSRFATTLMGAFAVLALTLAVVGTYGVLASSVASRTREFGIRMALGADRGALRRMILGYAAALVVPGTVLGVVGAWYGSRWIEAFLFQVDPGDPLIHVAVLVVFVTMGAVAGWLPARRATLVDPAATLSSE